MRLHTARLIMISMCILAAAAVTIPGATAQQSPPGQDEVLVTIRTDDVSRARRITPSPVRWYQRFAEFFVAGTDRGAFSVLRSKGVDAVIIDEQPWTQSYAVITLPPGRWRGNALPVQGVRILVAGTDFCIIKCDPAHIEALRGSGYSCVEIERREIPVETAATHLPADIGQNRDGVVDSLIAFVSDTSIRNYIQGMQNFGTRYWNNANHDSVSKWIRAKYVAAGIADVQLDSFQYNSTWQANVVATIPGTVHPTRELIVGGHHDSYNSANQNLAPGADDNASGTAAAMEMARVVKLTNYQPAYTMRFMGYAAEEAGLRGSASYAQRARAANRDIRCMQNYDMVANRYQAPTDQSVYVVWYTTSEAYRDLHAKMMQMYTPLIPVATTSYRSGSDSYSFWQQNYRTVFCIERNFSPYYHSQNDLLQYLDMTYVANITKAGLAMLLTLDQMPASVENVRVRDAGTGTSLRVQWDSVFVADWAGYKVYVGTSPGVYDTSYLQTVRQRTITGLTQGTAYYIGVSIVDLAGYESIIVEGTGIPRLVPLPPEGLTSQTMPNAVQLRWRSNTELDLRGYKVYRAPGAGLPFESLTAVPVADTVYLDSSLPPSTVLFYYVTAMDSTDHESAPSDTIQVNPTVGVDESVIPFTFHLDQNYPNPFNPFTQVVFEIDKAGPVRLVVYDLLGRKVATLVDETRPAGTYAVTWDAGAQASGVYMYTLTSGGNVATKRMMLIK